MVVTASNRASAGVYEDRSGQVLAEGLRELGFAVEGPHVLPDDVDELAAVLRAAVDAGVDVVLTTGGTGLSPTDVTPEATRAGAGARGAGHRRGRPPVRRRARRADGGALPRAGRHRGPDADREPARLDRRRAATAWPCSARCSPTSSASSAAATTERSARVRSCTLALR